MERPPAVGPLDLEALKARALAAYEAGRRRRALRLALPFLAVGAIGALAGPRPWLAAAVGVVIAALAFGSFVRGRSLERAVLPGTLAGFIPFGLAQGTRLWSHACVDGHCMSVCVPACVSGGLVAGLLVAGLARRSRAPRTFYAAGFTFSALTGALGCACVGFSGVLGLLIGLFTVLAPAVVLSPRRSTP